MTRFHDHSKVFDFRDVELAFLELEVEVKLGHSLKDMVSSLGVSFWVRGGDEKVVHVDDEPPFSNHVLEGVIHESLECCWGVTKAKEHDGGFEESFVGDEGSLPLVTVLDVNIVVAPMNIKLGKVASVFQLVHEVRNKGKGVCISGGMFVEVAIILARAKLAIFLLDKEEGGCLGGVRRVDLPSG